MRDRHKLFAKYYATPGTNAFHNATQSAILAGFSEKSAREIGCRTLQRDDVKEEIERIESSISTYINVDPKWIKDQAYLCYDKALQRGDYIAAKQFLELAGKCVGAFRDRAEDRPEQALEPSEPEEREAWLKRELQIIQEQKEAGDGLPRE
jgi:hypothetical protein